MALAKGLNLILLSIALGSPAVAAQVQTCHAVWQSDTLFLNWRAPHDSREISAFRKRFPSYMSDVQEALGLSELKIEWRLQSLLKLMRARDAAGDSDALESFAQHFHRQTQRPLDYRNTLQAYLPENEWDGHSMLLRGEVREAVVTMMIINQVESLLFERVQPSSDARGIIEPLKPLTDYSNALIAKGYNRDQSFWLLHHLIKGDY